MAGELSVPPSKSYFLRAMALAVACKGETRIENIGCSDDERVGLSLAQALGAEIEFIENNKVLLVRSTGLVAKKYSLDCGESALALRLFSCLAALLPVPIEVIARGTLLRRTQDPFSQIFPFLGVLYQSTKGYPPLMIQGPMQLKSTQIKASLSSQFVSGLLLAYAAAGARNEVLRLFEPTSTPYLDMSVSLIAQFGCPIQHTKDHTHFDFLAARPLRPTRVVVPADWSSAAYLLVAAALSRGAPLGKEATRDKASSLHSSSSHTESLRLLGLSSDSLQADRVIVPILLQAGVDVVMRHSLQDQQICVEVFSSRVLKPFQYNLEQCPDLFPALAALAAYACGRSYLSGLHRLAHKESKRGENIMHLLRQVGIFCEKNGNTLCIEGQGAIRGGMQVSGYEDHRMVMMGALLALRSREGLYLTGHEAVSKSFPSFFKLLGRAGIKVQTLG